MDNIDNLTHLIESRLPRGVVALLREAGREAQELGEPLYLVGGAVRDLLLGRETLDLDLVVEGDAMALVERLAARDGGRLVLHHHFGTAKWRRSGSIFDVVTARSETYDHPGALPTVRPGSIKDDLFRRDFTVNAMATRLSPVLFGELVDPYRGLADLRAGLIRILHYNSFIDDATRILRAIRYEQRLGFKLEQETERLLRSNGPMLDTISGDRLRHELELILKEAPLEQVLSRMALLGVLKDLHPGLEWDLWLRRKLQVARKTVHDGLAEVYLLLLAYRFTPLQADSFLERFRLPRKLARSLKTLIDLRDRIETPSHTRMTRLALYRFLEKYPVQSIETAMIAADSNLAREQLRLYLDELRNVRPTLTGEDLRAMGVPAGEAVGEVLGLLREALLEGHAHARDEEEALVKRWVEKTG